MSNNIFLPVLQSRGFSQGFANRWFSPDCKRGDGVVVEITDKNAIAVWRGGRTLFEADKPEDVARFRREVR